MRHGRKTRQSYSTATSGTRCPCPDERMILACAVEPANRPESDATPALRVDLARQCRSDIDELLIDRGYINSVLVDDLRARRGTVICRQWVGQNGGRYTKAQFDFNLRDRTITSPAGQTQPLHLGATIEFPEETCHDCLLRPQCTIGKSSHGRTLHIADDELLQERLRRAAATRPGRARLRERTHIEHRLSHVVRRQGKRARYLGQRKNLFDVRRASSVANLEALHLIVRTAIADRIAA